MFIAPPKRWRLPLRSDILIYDECGADRLAPYFSEYSVERLAVRGEYVYVFCLFRAAFSRQFWVGTPTRAYTDVFIKMVSPEILVTLVDNNPEFYSISHRFPGVPTIFVQNGTRGEFGDIFGSLAKTDLNHVDYMLVHGRAIGREYEKFISGETIAVGALHNNAVPKSTDVDGRTVLFVSQYQDKTQNNDPMWIEKDGTPVYWEQFHAADVRVLQFLGRWCAHNNKALKICARGSETDCPEREFYSHILKEFVWEYIPRGNFESSYRLVDRAGIVAFIDSTLGYESFSRGKKTAAFSCRVVGGVKTSHPFGWPAGLPDNGPFWTNDLDESEFMRVLDFLDSVSEEAWGDVLAKYSGELIQFDPGNTKFRALIDRLVPKSHVRNGIQ